jgi:Fe-S-cluster-containing dehydrogenase component
VLTACQQGGPTSAIIFGNLHDEKSNLAEVVTQPQNYSLLDELQTVPRTTYLPRYTNELKGVAPYERSIEDQEGNA